MSPPRRLSPREGAELDARGYVVIETVANDAELERLRAAFERAALLQASAAPGAIREERHVEGLADKDETFDLVLTNARVLDGVRRVLRRPFSLFHMNGRDPLPGRGQQGLHADWLTRMPGEPYAIVTALWLLDDFSPENGATRLVPGSHLLFKPVPKEMQARHSRHPDQIVVSAPAGSVLLFNGHLWHGGTRNASGRSRRAVQCQFADRERTPPGLVPPELPENPALAARRLFGDSR